jgi:hypothetical protein
MLSSYKKSIEGKFPSINKPVLYRIIPAMSRLHRSGFPHTFFAGHA